MRLRRAKALFVHWQNNELIVTNFLTRVSAAAHPTAIRLLNYFGTWRRPERAALFLSEYDSRQVHAAVKKSQRLTLLLQEDSREAKRDSRLARVWYHWLPYGAFHFGTKDPKFILGKEDEDNLRNFLKESRQPPFFKSYPGLPHVFLPSPIPPKGEFSEVLMKRRTVRKFSNQPLPLDVLSTLLKYSCGVTGYIQAGVLGSLPLKTSPSGGARHPVEIYVVALRVNGLSPGIYHYDARKHRLDQLKQANMRGQAAAFCAGQTYAKDAAALLVMTAVLPRNMWKYRHPRAYRVVLLDAGHLCQTICLTATWLGLGPFSTAALKDTLIEKELGVDGITEVALYVAGIGFPASVSR